MKNDYTRMAEEEREKKRGEEADKASEPGFDWGKPAKRSFGRFWQWVILALLLLLIGAAIFWVLYEKGRGKAAAREKEQAAPVSETSVPRPKPVPAPAKTYEPLDVPLAGSDEFVRGYSRGLSADSLLAALLGEKEMIRRFVAVVDDIARGESPRPLLEFLVPKSGFSVVRRGDAILMDPAGARRYDHLAGFFDSLDEAKCVELYQRFAPLCGEAYAELGHKSGDFDASLAAAVNQVLAVPVREDALALYEKPLGMGFDYVDERLQSLSDAQKHFLRMGPRNLRRIKQKLHRLMEALGMAQRLKY